ncbi:hypothetical protein SAMN04488505_109118 [Chitinophaga rupis]|uniref:Uncharacterized protein n=2 Tax=Chitinophaga rupis TaxID=573321 RepID=A0A1H8F777_9BACT|nr:hypothetical protein SAMN04488505_109118 [Chitinophaga rupis]
MDIDWFAIDVDQNIALFASGGGILPATILELEEAIYHEVIKFMRALPEIADNNIWINQNIDVIKSLQTVEQRNRYLEDYVFMAKKGLIVFDKTVLMAEMDYKYHLVALPAIKLDYQDLPESILNIVSRTRSQSSLSGKDFFFTNEIL